MKVVGRYSTPEDAHLAKMKLSVNGVESYLFDEYTIQTYWYISNAIGGIRLQVDDEDVERALEVLREENVEEEINCPACPKCSSGNTREDRLPRSLACLTMIFPGFPLICIGRQNRCLDCDSAWNARHPVDVKPGAANQFFGAQLLILGGVFLLFLLVSFIGRYTRPLGIYSSSAHDRFSELKSSFSFHESIVYIPSWFLIPGICLVVLGLIMIKTSLPSAKFSSLPDED